MTRSETDRLADGRDEGHLRVLSCPSSMRRRRSRSGLGAYASVGRRAWRRPGLLAMSLPAHCMAATAYTALRPGWRDGCCDGCASSAQRVLRRPAAAATSTSASPRRAGALTLVRPPWRRRPRDSPLVPSLAPRRPAPNPSPSPRRRTPELPRRESDQPFRPATLSRHSPSTPHTFTHPQALFATTTSRTLPSPGAPTVPRQPPAPRGPTPASPRRSTMGDAPPHHSYAGSPPLFYPQVSSRRWACLFLSRWMKAYPSRGGAAWVGGRDRWGARSLSRSPTGQGPDKAPSPCHAQNAWLAIAAQEEVR